MQKKYFFLTFVFLLIGILYYPRLLFAETTKPYLITQPFTAPPPPVAGSGYVYFHKGTVIDYQSGKLYFSEKEDGTGTTDVNDGIIISFYGPYGTLRYSFSYFPVCGSPQSKLPPLDLTHYLAKGFNNVLVRMIDWCGKSKSVSSLYFVNKHIKNVGPQFLELPWDYGSKNQSFETAALAMTSYFDHEYPLLSTNLQEPGSASGLVDFFGNKGNKSYSSHDGYDYASPSRLRMGDPVLAAASGSATYVNNCGACGNMILIDHGNNYQTRYMHLQKDGLITSTQNSPVTIQARQKIGKVGATGNVWPAGDAGAHIHFMVVQDKNKDGNFNDNIPDGLTDPFGWQSTQADPWENYSFNYRNTAQQGNKSLYLWKQEISSIFKPLAPKGGEFKMEHIRVLFPVDSVKEIYALEIRKGMRPKTILKFKPSISPQLNQLFVKNISNSLSEEITPITSTLMISIKDVFGNSQNTLLKQATIEFEYADESFINIDPATLALYSSNEAEDWIPETTATINLQTKKVTLLTQELKAQYVLAAKNLDAIAPETNIHISQTDNGEKQLSFSSIDNENGSGVDYIIYKLDEKEWELFENTSINLNKNKEHIVQYYAEDTVGNIEEIKLFIEGGIPTASPTITPNLTPSPTAVISPTPIVSIIQSPIVSLTSSPIPTPLIPQQSLILSNISIV